MDKPDLDLDWELGLFKAVRALVRALRPAPALAYDASTVALLEDLRPRLTLLGRLVGPSDLEIHTARTQGGVRGHHLLLPEWIDATGDAELNAGAYLLRTLVGARVAQAGPAVSGDPILDAPVMAACVDRAVTELTDELPRFGPAWAAMRTAVPEPLLWGRLIVRDVCAGALADDDDDPTPRPTSEHDAKPIEDVVQIDLNEQRELELPIHAFEKVETAEAFNGTLRKQDGSDELDEQLEALEEVDLSHLVRGGPQTHSVLRAEVGLELEIPHVQRIAPGERAVLYDEWDMRAKRFRRDWCAVYPTPLPLPASTPWVDQATADTRRQADALRAELVRQRTRPRHQPRQRDGDAIDLDAWVDGWADRAAGRDPGDRMYVQTRPQERELATLVLLDVSLSTDAWVAGRRVLDLCRQAVLVLGQATDGLGDVLSVMAFASHTRNQVRAFTVQDWGEPWSMGRRRLELLRPQGYTRIGPALRHAAHHLDQSGCPRRLLLVLTDGKPTDYDRYEGRYGLADVRRAVRDIRGGGTAVHAVAFDTHARPGLTRMMGPGGWDLVHRLEQLPQALGTAVARLQPA